MKKMVLAIAVLAVLVAGITTIPIVMVRKNRDQAAEISMLQSQIMELQRESTNEGGAETQIPPTPVADSQYVFPVAEGDFRTYTSPYGERISPILNVPMFHNGLDIGGTWRARIVSVGDGYVLPPNEVLQFADGTSIEGGHWPAPDGWFKGHDTYGGLVIIRHDEGHYTLYGHLSSTEVSGGERVVAGQMIGRMGNTGKSDGSHLHFEWITAEGERENPLLYVGIE